MIHFDEFRKDSAPAFGESEKVYFQRITTEYRRLCKREVRQLRLTRCINILRTLLKRLIIKPNLLSRKTV